jgi:hypothetical protein
MNYAVFSLQNSSTFRALQIVKSISNGQIFIIQRLSVTTAVLKFILFYLLWETGRDKVLRAGKLLSVN